MKNNLIYDKIVEVLQYIVQAQDEVARVDSCVKLVFKSHSKPLQL
jgi:hypothetical protein